jgi:hypothetical protein
VNSASKKHISATIVVEDRQFYYRINPDGVFGTHHCSCSARAPRTCETSYQRLAKSHPAQVGLRGNATMADNNIERILRAVSSRRVGASAAKLHLRSPPPGRANIPVPSVRSRFRDPERACPPPPDGLPGSLITVTAPGYNCSGSGIADRGMPYSQMRYSPHPHCFRNCGGACHRKSLSGSRPYLSDGFSERSRLSVVRDQRVFASSTFARKPCLAEIDIRQEGDEGCQEVQAIACAA